MDRLYPVSAGARGRPRQFFLRPGPGGAKAPATLLGPDPGGAMALPYFFGPGLGGEVATSIFLAPAPDPGFGL